MLEIRKIVLKRKYLSIYLDENACIKTLIAQDDDWQSQSRMRVRRRGAGAQVRGRTLRAGMVVAQVRAGRRRT